MQLVGPWVTPFICVVWYGNKWMFMACLCWGMEGRSLGIFPCPHHVAWQTWVSVYPPPLLHYVDLI